MVVEITADALELVDKIAKWAHRRSGYSYDDARGAGMIGLVEASLSWRPGKASFISYAGARIRWAIQDEMRRMSPGTRKQQGEGKRPKIISIDYGYVDDEDYWDRFLRADDDVEGDVLDRVMGEQAMDVLFSTIPWRSARAVFETVVRQRTLIDVGSEFGITDGGVCRHRTRGLKLLRKELSHWEGVA